MNRYVLLWCLLFASVAAPATAQSFNFELDNYTAAVNGSTPAAGYLWQGNPNVTHQVATVKSDRNVIYYDTGCVWVPGRFNMERGDAVLSAEPGSVIYKLLSSLGQPYSHSGMTRWSTSLRHNTLETGAIDTDGTSLKATGSHSLRDGWPGLTTQTVEAATSWQEFNVANGLVLYNYSPTGFPDSKARTANREAQKTAAADKMDAMRGYYRLYAYTNMTWKDPMKLATNDGNICSGSIYYANALAGNVYWDTSDWVTYSASTRDGVAPTLFNAVKNFAKDETDWYEDVILALGGIVGGPSLNDVATSVANQAVNCMAFNDCGNTGTRWKNGVGTGKTMSPYDLYGLAAAAAYVASLVGADTGFVYNGAKSIQVTGNYFCCPGGNDRAGWTTCSYQ